jgi:hypothetical protein
MKIHPYAGFTPVCTTAIPCVNLRKDTRENPIRFRMADNSSGKGKRRMDSGR